MSEKQSPAAIRGAKRKAFYAAQFARTEANKRRRVKRHRASHPRDVTALKIYGGEVKLTRKGWKSLHRKEPKL